MRFSFIDMIFAEKHGLNASQAVVFAWMYNLPTWAKRSTIDSIDFYFASRLKAVSDLPIITDKTDTMYRYFKELEKKGLILYEKIGSCDYVAISEIGKTWNRAEHSDKYPSDGSSQKDKLGESSENDSQDSEKVPTYNKDTSYNNHITDTINSISIDEDFSDSDFGISEGQEQPNAEHDKTTDKKKTVHGEGVRLTPQKKEKPLKAKKEPTYQQCFQNAMFGAVTKLCGQSATIGIEANQIKFITRELVKMIPEGYNQQQLDTIALKFIASCQKIAKFEKFIMKNQIPSQYYKHLAHVITNIRQGEKLTFIEGLRIFLNEDVKVKPLHTDETKVKKQIYG